MAKTAHKTGSSSSTGPAPKRPKLDTASISRASKGKSKAKTKSKAKPKMPKGAICQHWLLPALERKFDISTVLGPSASLCKLSNDERRDAYDNIKGRKYLMLEYLAQKAGMNMAHLDRQLPLFDSSKRLLGMTQEIEFPPEEDENTDSDVIDAGLNSDKGEWTEEEEGAEEDEDEDARTPPHRPSRKRAGITPAHAEREDSDDDVDAET